MENKYVNISGRIIYSPKAEETIKDLARGPSGRIPSSDLLTLTREGEWLCVNFGGRENVAREIKAYIRQVNYDGTHEAMMAALRFKARRNKWVKE